MKRIVVILMLFMVAGAIGVILVRPDTQLPDTEEGKQVQPPTETKQPLPTDEQAELTGFQFVQDFIAVAPPDPDPSTQTRTYNALSRNAKKNVSEDTLSGDLAAFFGVQDVPDLGASVEDLQKPSDYKAILIVGLNYSGGRVLRAIHLVVEDGEWKVEKIEPLEQYPPED